MLSYNILPDALFNGTPLKKINLNNYTSFFGEASDVEMPDSGTNDEQLTICHFDEQKFSLFFQDGELLTLSVSNPAFQLFEQPVFKLKENELIELFASNSFTEFEIDKDWGEKQLVFESAGITFFFDNQKVSEVFIDLV
jgi:hypothetical protein